MDYTALRPGSMAGGMGLTPLQGVKSFFTNKVMLLKVGDVPKDKFTFYLRALGEAGSCVEMKHMSYQSTFKENNPFKCSSWKGKMHFEFLEMETLKMDWDIFHAHKAIQAVIAVCYCPFHPDLAVPYAKFQEMKESLSIPGGPRYFKCYAFEPLDDQEDVPERHDLIMFPNEGADKLNFYLSTWIRDLAKQLLQDYECWANKSDHDILFVTPLETDASPAKQKKLQSGRLQKRLGSFFLKK